MILAAVYIPSPLHLMPVLVRVTPSHGRESDSESGMIGTLNSPVFKFNLKFPFGGGGGGGIARGPKIRDPQGLRASPRKL